MTELKLDRALQIEGWMSFEELSWLAERAQSRSHIVEIGSWRGRSTRALADNTPGAVWAVDTWSGSPEHAAELKEHPKGWLYGEFCRNTRDLRNLTRVVATSKDAADLFRRENRRVDFAFIDGDHIYPRVWEDATLWRRLLSPGGLLAGHDYGGMFAGVKRAVDDALGAGNVRRGPGEIWYWEGE